MQEDNKAKEPNAFEALKSEHILEKQRFESFKFWPFPETAACSKSKMAQAGWYWTGTKEEPDTATCFLCAKTLDGWEETDDPWKEHARHAPQCQFVQLGREEERLTVSEVMDIFGTVLTKKVSKECEQLKKELQTEATQVLNSFIKSHKK